MLLDNYLFSGLRVIDAATVIAAPAAAMMLADFGADVIKIEQPGAGDMLRIIRDVPETVPGGEDYMWQMDGRNKRGITLDHHLTHLLVHGTLHLLGYDHLTDDEGDAMEEIERRALADQIGRAHV